MNRCSRGSAMLPESLFSSVDRSKTHGTVVGFSRVTNRESELEVRPGGTIRIHLRGPRLSADGG